MVLVGSRVATRAAPVLAAATPGPRAVAVAGTRPLRRAIRRHERPRAEGATPEGDGTTETPRGLLP